jgi:hypothetical protein
LKCCFYVFERKKTFVWKSVIKKSQTREKGQKSVTYYLMAAKMPTSRRGNSE